MRLTKEEKQAAQDAFRAECERLNKLETARDDAVLAHQVTFIKKYLPTFDPEAASQMAMEYFDDLPKWLHEFVTEASQEANEAAREAAESAAKAAAVKAEAETYLSVFKKVFDEQTTNAIAQREGRWTYDTPDGVGRMLADDEQLIDGKAVKMGGVTNDAKLTKLFAVK
jgi:hypothetical protein